MNNDSTKFLIIGIILGLAIGFFAGQHHERNQSNDFLRIRIGSENK